MFLHTNQNVFYVQLLTLSKSLQSVFKTEKSIIYTPSVCI